jgi:hypothetical protein
VAANPARQDGLSPLLLIGLGVAAVGVVLLGRRAVRRRLADP